MSTPVKDPARRAAIKIRTLPVSKEAGESQYDVPRSLVDPWESVDGDARHVIIKPPIDPFSLLVLYEHSTELEPNVGAMETGITGFGYRLKQRSSNDDADEKVVRAEWIKYSELLDYLSHEQENTEALFAMTVRHMELTGNAYWEVVRNRAGRISSISLLLPHLIRLTKPDKEFTEIEQRRVLRDGTIVARKIKRRFRRFVSARNGQIGVWYREYGDTRDMDHKTGERDKIKTRATEILHWRINAVRSAYGTPRFIGAIMAVTGPIHSQKTNEKAIRNNRIPNVLLMVAGAEVTEGSVKRLTEFRDQQLGEDSRSNIVIVEMESLEEDDDMSTGDIKYKIERLSADQHNDALFQDYEKQQGARVRRMWRLPPILTGQAEDYTRSNAETSRRLADEQVMAPERRRFDHTMNRVLVDEGCQYHVFELNSPNVTDDQNIIQVMGTAEKTGGMTPRISRMMLEDIMGSELPPWTDEALKVFDPDVSFSIQMAEMVKNKAEPNEPGKQVTALKGIAAFKSLIPILTQFEDGAVLNVGDQAQSVASGVGVVATGMSFYLVDKSYKLSDGDVIYGTATFGSRSRATLDEAAPIVGVEVDTLKTMFPDRGELWMHSITSWEPELEPVTYDHTSEGPFHADG